MNNVFPTEWQRVIFRNYGFAQVDRIASVLKTDAVTVKKEAERMGLCGDGAPELWTKRGFVTIIRSNFDILPDEDIATLIGVTKKEYDKLLIEYDFLNVKLGEKPETHEVSYLPLSKEEIAETEKIRCFIKSEYIAATAEPFDFYSHKPNFTPHNADYEIKDRFISHYSADYAGLLNDDELSDFSEDYLGRISACGITGLWIHESLKNITEFPFDRSLSAGYEKRLINLKKLTERCKKHGVDIYLYLNEPRSLPAEFFDEYPELKGSSTPDGGYCLCSSRQEVKDYLFGAVKSLAENVPLLKAVMTITMSENPTHCHSMKKNDCKTCAERRPEEVAAEVNNIICRALKAGNGYTKLIANLWGWSDFMKWTDEMVFRGIDLLDKDVEVLCVSEYGKKFVKGGVSSEVIDYSISEVGPSEISEKTLSYAKKAGHKIWSKVQVNNSWECSGVPFIPTFDLMTQHIKNMKNLGVEGLMLGWSLGGYPGGALPLCSALCAKDFDEEKWYKEVYGKRSETVREAVKIFSGAFTEFPFSIDTLYYAGQTLSCANYYSLRPDRRTSTMVCFTFDDYELWTNPYGIDIFISQMKKVCDGFEKGLKVIEGLDGNDEFKEFCNCAKGTAIHFKASMNTALFSKYKRDITNDKDKLAQVLNDEYENAKELYALMGRDALIGYEATNHYFYTRNSILEKMLNVKDVLRALEEI